MSNNLTDEESGCVGCAIILTMVIIAISIAGVIMLKLLAWLWRVL